jgi:hypothetical protein
MNPAEHRPRVRDLFQTRREFLGRCGLGIGMLGLTTLLSESGALGNEVQIGADPLAPRRPHFPARVKRIIHVFPVGGPSQVDTFDPKPALQKYHNRPITEVVGDYDKKAPESAVGMGRLRGRLQRSPFAFKKHGKSGTEISELFPHLARHADDLCVVRSLSTSSSVHQLAQLIMNTGDPVQIRPSMGSWTVYGLGTENRSLPAFVSLYPGAGVATGERNWSGGFLPNWAGGTGMSTRNASVEKMIEHIRSGSTSLREQRRQLDLLGQMNAEYQERLGQESLLEARIRSFETAFRMQVEAAEAFDISREPASVRELYGDTEQGRQLLLARRLVENGVRYVQAWHQDWDTHDENDERHRLLARGADQPLAALLADLKSRDMLKDTLVLWAGEFGRTPTSDSNNVAVRKGIGRDHNAGGFSIWMAGGGVKSGLCYGATDDFGVLAVEGRMEVHDLHATILHLLGFDHEKLIYRHAGRDFRLTDVYGKVNHDLLA